MYFHQDIITMFLIWYYVRCPKLGNNALNVFILIKLYETVEVFSEVCMTHLASPPRENGGPGSFYKCQVVMEAQRVLRNKEDMEIELLIS